MYRDRFQNPGQSRRGQGQASRGQWRGQRGGRGRGYQNQGRHKRYNDNGAFSLQNQPNSGGNSNFGADNQASRNDEMTEGLTNSEKNDQRSVMHFHEASDYYAQDEQDKSFAETAEPPAAVKVKKGYNNRGGKSYSRGTHRQRGILHVGASKSESADECKSERKPETDAKLAQKEARQKRQSRKDKQWASKDDEESESMADSSNRR